MKTFFAVVLIIFALVCVSPIISEAGNKTLNFAWQQTLPSPNDMSGWELYIANTAGGTATLFATIPYVSSASEYTTTQTITVPDGTTSTRYFKILAFDSSGNKSGFSNEVAVSLDFAPPNVPITLRVTVVPAP